TGRKYATTTDIDGVYQMQVPRNGRYVIKTELTGFAPVTKEVVVNAAGQNGGLPVQSAELQMELVSRVAPDTETAPTTASNPASTGTAAGRSTAGTIARTGRGTQALNLQNNDASGVEDASTGQGNAGVQGPSLSEV